MYTYAPRKSLMPMCPFASSPTMYVGAISRPSFGHLGPSASHQHHALYMYVGEGATVSDGESERRCDCSAQVAALHLPRSWHPPPLPPLLLLTPAHSPTVAQQRRLDGSAWQWRPRRGSSGPPPPTATATTMVSDRTLFRPPGVPPSHCT